MSSVALTESQDDVTKVKLHENMNAFWWSQMETEKPEIYQVSVPTSLKDS